MSTREQKEIQKLKKAATKTADELNNELLVHLITPNRDGTKTVWPPNKLNDAIQTADTFNLLKLPQLKR